MKLTVIVVALVVSSVLALSAQTAKPMSDQDYAKVMKQIGPAFTNLQKKNGELQSWFDIITTGDDVAPPAGGANDAQMLSDWFKQVQGYWEGKRANDAVEFARRAALAADVSVKATGEANLGVLSEAQGDLFSACQGCHMAHREKLADGTYRIK